MKRTISALLAIVIIGAIILIMYPLAATGRPPLGVTNLDSLHLSDTGGTAVPILRANQKGTGKIVEFLDGGTPVWSLINGGEVVAPGGQTLNNLYVNAPTAIATTTPAALVNSLGVSNLFEVREATTPIALLKGWGAVTVTTTTTKHVLEIIDTSPVMTAGTNIYSAVNIDLEIGNSTAGTNNVYAVLFDDISGDAQVTETAIGIAGIGWDVGFSAGGNKIDLDADDDTSISASVDDTIAIEIGGATEQTLTAASFDLNDTYLDQDIGTENLGVLPSVVSTAFTYTAAAGGSGTIATIADGEIWIVHRVIISVTTSFTATGDDVTLDIGDGNDADGMLNLADADLKVGATDYTGAQAGWQGLDGATPTGVYLIGGPQVYAPSGADETIDWLLDETSGETITSGAATVYVHYTRIQ